MAHKEKTDWGGLAVASLAILIGWALFKGRGTVTPPPPPPPPPSEPPPPLSPPPPPPGKATLYGQVTSEGKPVAGARILTAVRIEVGQPESVYGQALSDTDGNYFIPDRDLGPAQVACSKEGHTGVVLDITLVGGNNRYDFVLIVPPTIFIVPVSPTLADAAALRAKIQASPYRTPLPPQWYVDATGWPADKGMWPAVELVYGGTDITGWPNRITPEEQLVELSNYVSPDGSVGNWWGPMYLVPQGYMAQAVLLLPPWARQIYLLLAEL